MKYQNICDRSLPELPAAATFDLAARQCRCDSQDHDFHAAMHRFPTNMRERHKWPVPHGGRREREIFFDRFAAPSRSCRPAPQRDDIGWKRGDQIRDVAGPSIECFALLRFEAVMPISFIHVAVVMVLN